MPVCCWDIPTNPFICMVYPVISWLIVCSQGVKPEGLSLLTSTFGSRGEYWPLLLLLLTMTPSVPCCIMPSLSRPPRSGWSMLIVSITLLFSDYLQS